MRVTLNAILSFIGAEALTEGEWTDIAISEGASASAQYQALRHVLGDRESVSNMYSRLASYFKAQGYSFTSEATPVNTNIFVGSRL
jgi:hypothetical protein